MAARIPPRGTPGYTAYWGDRYAHERLDKDAKEWAGIAQRAKPYEKAACEEVAQHLRAAADAYKKLWETTDYFALNTQKGTSA